MLKHLIIATSLSLLITLPGHTIEEPQGKNTAEVGQSAKTASEAMASAAPKMDFSQTVWKVAVEEGISMDDAIDSMKLRANSLNMKLVGHQPLSQELEAQGIPDVRRMEIFQFCDAQIAKKMVDYNTTFAAYLPCRIAAITDKEGKDWLVTLNMDMIMGMVTLSPELKILAKKVRDNIDDIIHAGAAGEL